MGLDLKKIIRETPSRSKKQAVDRLRLVVVHDRSKISPGLMERLKEEIINSISRYVEIDEDEMEIELNSTKTRVELVANMPVRSIRRV